MKVRFLSFAEQELDDAVAYYAAISRQLGTAFVAEAVQVRDRIAEAPFAWHPLEKPFRQCRLRRFPYAFIYQVRETEVIIVAVAHLRRQPGYWRARRLP